MGTNLYETPSRGRRRRALASVPPIVRSVAPSSVLPNKFYERFCDGKNGASAEGDVRSLTVILIPFCSAHSSSSRGRGRPLYRTSSRLISIFRSFGSIREFLR